MPPKYLFTVPSSVFSFSWVSGGSEQGKDQENRENQGQHRDDCAKATVRFLSPPCFRKLTAFPVTVQWKPDVLVWHQRHSPNLAVTLVSILICKHAAHVSSPCLWLCLSTLILACPNLNRSSRTSSDVTSSTKSSSFLSSSRKSSLPYCSYNSL